MGGEWIMVMNTFAVIVVGVVIQQLACSAVVVVVVVVQLPQTPGDDLRSARAERESRTC